MPSRQIAPTTPFKLGLLLFPGCMPAGLFAVNELVRACNLRAGRVGIATTWVAVAREAVATHQGPSLRAQAALAEAGCDALLVPGLWLTSTEALADALHAQSELVETLRALPRGTQVWSYCAGVGLVAAAGRLDRHAATATWWLQAALSTQFPRVQWQGGADLVIDRHIATASGPNGHLPLMLDRLARHFPAEVLQDVQELLMLPTPRSRHAAFEPVEMMRLADPALRTLLAWAQRTPAQGVTLAEAAQQQSVSIRTLCRLVERGTGMAAGEWLRRVKLGQAAEALRGTRNPVKAISEQLGFGSEASLYRAFRSATGMTPSAYRQTYGAMVLGAGLTNPAAATIKARV